MELKLIAIVALVALTAIILIRKKRAKAIKEEMVLHIIHAMDDYESAYPYFSASAAPIFLNSIKFVDMQSLRTLRKSMVNNNVNTKMGAMNIVHNFALMELTKEVPTVDYLISTEELVPKDSALRVYEFINDIKYQNNYISHKQYIDNQKLGKKYYPFNINDRWQ